MSRQVFTPFLYLLRNTAHLGWSKEGSVDSGISLFKILKPQTNNFSDQNDIDKTTWWNWYFIIFNKLNQLYDWEISFLTIFRVNFGHQNRTTYISWTLKAQRWKFSTKSRLIEYWIEQDAIQIKTLFLWLKSRKNTSESNKYFTSLYF